MVDWLNPTDEMLAGRRAGQRDKDREVEDLEGRVVDAESKNECLKKAMSAALMEKLKRLSERSTWDDEDDFNPMEFSGGNFDDAYRAGRADGETVLARGILKDLDE